MKPEDGPRSIAQWLDLARGIGGSGLIPALVVRRAITGQGRDI